MKRREALKKTSWILKSAVLAPTVITALESCRKDKHEPSDLSVLNSNEDQLVISISDTIIPRTESPGATDVGVNKFIDLLLHDVFDHNVVKSFLEGLHLFDQQCEMDVGKSFIRLDQQERENYLQSVDQEVMSKSYDEEVPFYYTFKYLTTTIYFTSEQGVKQNLNYQPVPGPYQGEVELKHEDRIMVGNNM